MSFFSEDCSFDSPQEPDQGISAKGRFEGIPDVQYLQDNHWVADNKGLSEWTLKGTTTSGLHLEVRGCDFWEFESDKIERKD